jgi:hypothetical protein
MAPAFCDLARGKVEQMTRELRYGGRDARTTMNVLPMCRRDARTTMKEPQ